jgi:hypothetical protein
MGFVRQANIAHGREQVNNVLSPASEAPPARAYPNLQDRLLEEKDGKRLDIGATGAAG